MASQLFPANYGEREEIVAGHVELVNVLWELGIEPDLRMLPEVYPTPAAYPPSPTRETAIQVGVRRIGGEQWAHWPLGEEQEAQIRRVLETRFDELFTQTADGYSPAWIKPGREVLIAWKSRRRSFTAIASRDG